jgi:hypothetical protein
MVVQVGRLRGRFVPHSGTLNSQKNFTRNIYSSLEMAMNKGQRLIILDNFILVPGMLEGYVTKTQN